MVGYNFQPIFEPQIRDGRKRQTVRGPRKRHAQPGEPVQLFTDQRTRHCRKLLSPDPTCIRVRPIEIAVSEIVGIASIAIEGIPLDDEEVELFATADGFGLREVGDLGIRHGRQVMPSARANMGIFWLYRHGAGRFDGFLIQWEPA